MQTRIWEFLSKCNNTPKDHLERYSVAHSQTFEAIDNNKWSFPQTIIPYNFIA